jgi:GT2 family glycosyltransferase
MKIGITAPVFLTVPDHKKYLDFTSKSIKSKDHSLVFIPVENYIDPAFLPIMYTITQEPIPIVPVRPAGEQSVSKAWNLGIEKGVQENCDYILVINTDIVFKSNAIDRLVAFANKHPEAAMWTASEYVDLAAIEQAPEDEGYNEHPHFSCFMVKPDFFSHAGKFDENFVPGYVEDSDMHYRLTLAGQKCYTYGGSRFFHFGSRVIKSDRELWEKNKITFPKVQQYFLNKWGHPVVNEVNEMKKVYFPTPFNDPAKDYKWWPDIAEPVTKV